MGQVAHALEEDLLKTSQDREGLIRLIGIVSFKRMEQVFLWTKEAKAKQTERIQLILDELTRILRDTALIKIDPEATESSTKT